MQPQLIKHSVVIICYNQEKFIENAIESVLKQSLKPFEIIILDDCSYDNTAEKAQLYLEAKAKLFNWRIIKNNENLGIPKNSKKIECVAAGNVITHLSGDDRLHPQTIEISNRLIEQNELDPEKDSFVSLSPTKLFYPKKSQTVKYKILNGNLGKSIIRKTIPFVKVGFSKKAFSDTEYPTDIGIWADWVWDVSICIKRDIQFYEIPFTLYWYTAGIGVGSKSNQQSLRDSYLKSAELILNRFRNQIDYLDRLYLLGEICYLRGILNNKMHFKFCGFLLYIINAITCGDMITFKSLTVRYLPRKLYMLIKKLLFKTASP